MTAMQILSKEFVMGNDFNSVIKSSNLKKYIHSFDMLGEAARTKTQAEGFYNSYVEAIERVANLNREHEINHGVSINCLLYTSPSPRDRTRSRMPSSA